MKVICHHCGGDAELVTGDVLYGYPSLAAKKFWSCEPCDAYVGCHPPARANGKGGHGDGTVPLGTLANRAERQARNRAHQAFDSMWQTGGPMDRKQAYAWLAAQLAITADACHIGMFDEHQCARVCRVVADYFSKLRRGSVTHQLPAGTVRPRRLATRTNQ